MPNVPPRAQAAHQQATAAYDAEVARRQADARARAAQQDAANQIAYRQAKAPFTINGFAPTDFGYREVAKLLADGLYGATPRVSKADEALVNGAVKMILRELETQVGGSARAFGETTPGQVEKAKRAFEAMMTMGKIDVAKIEAGTSTIPELVAAICGFEHDRDPPKGVTFTPLLSGRARPRSGDRPGFFARLFGVHGLVGMGDQVVERAVLRDELRRRLRPHPLHAGHVVNRVAHQG